MLPYLPEQRECSPSSCVGLVPVHLEKKQQFRVRVRVATDPKP